MTRQPNTGIKKLESEIKDNVKQILVSLSVAAALAARKNKKLKK